jgi:hypothetical protein
MKKRPDHSGLFSMTGFLRDSKDGGHEGVRVGVDSRASRRGLVTESPRVHKISAVSISI